MLCNVCGEGFHPELSACPACGTETPREAHRRSRFLYLINTVLVSAVALGVMVTAVGGAQAQTGMTATDCNLSRDLTIQTRAAVLALEGDLAARGRLQEISIQWQMLAENYTPGKFSWSTTGLEHNWLQRMGTATGQLASGDPVNVEGEGDPKNYLEALSRLLPRYCS